VIRLLIAFTFLFSGCKIFSQKKVVSAEVPVIISVTQTHSYCGGAKPPDELLQELATPRPLSGITFYIKNSDTNDYKPAIEVISNDSGIVYVLLKPGKYCLINDLKKDKNYYNELLKRYQKETQYYSPVNKECLDKWYEYKGPYPP
jgi:hypothetical protein